MNDHYFQTRREALLRPAFTRELAARLNQRASINLTAPHGMGRRRTLQDLRTLLPESVRVLYADMKFRLHDFPATLGDISTQAGINDTNITNLGELIESLAKQSASVLLILHNIDLLRNEPHDPLFDTALLPHLAEIPKQPNIALLTVSEAIYPDWPLPCEALALSPVE